MISPLSSLFYPEDKGKRSSNISDPRTQYSWFIKAFTKNILFTLQWTVCVWSTLISLTSILILSSHLQCGVPISLLLGTRWPNVYTFPIYLTIYTYHKTLYAEYKLQANYAIFSSTKISYPAICSYSWSNSSLINYVKKKTQIIIQCILIFRFL